MQTFRMALNLVVGLLLGAVVLELAKKPLEARQGDDDTHGDAHGPNW